MKRSTVTLLVCLSFFGSVVIAFPYDNQKSINVIINPLVDVPYESNTGLSGLNSDYPGTPSDIVSATAPRFEPASYRPYTGYARPISKIKSTVCAPGLICGPKPEPPCIVPRRFCRQWEISAQVFLPRLSGTLQWPGMVFGQPTSGIDLTDDLGLPKHPVLGEYSAYYQINWNWAIYYSIMPINLRGTAVTTKSFNYGNWLVTAGSQVHTDWSFIYQRLGLMYSFINTCNANVSIYTAWLYNPQQFRVSCTECPNWPVSTNDRTRQMLMSGINLRKCIRTLCNGATLACDSEFSIGYLDNTLVLDIEPGLRFSVPLNCNRWGFVKGGYRWLSFNENRNDLQMNLYLEGAYVEAGLIF